MAISLVVVVGRASENILSIETPVLASAGVFRCAPLKKMIAPGNRKVRGEISITMIYLIETLADWDRRHVWRALATFPRLEWRSGEPHCRARNEARQECRFHWLLATAPRGLVVSADHSFRGLW